MADEKLEKNNFELNDDVLDDVNGGLDIKSFVKGGGTSAKKVDFFTKLVDVFKDINDKEVKAPDTRRV